MLCFPDRASRAKAEIPRTSTKSLLHLTARAPTFTRAPPLTSKDNTLHHPRRAGRSTPIQILGRVGMLPFQLLGLGKQHQVPDVPLTLTLATAPQKRSIFPTWVPQTIAFQHSNAQLQNSSRFQHSNAHLMHFCQSLKCPNTRVTVFCFFRKRLV